MSEQPHDNYGSPTPELKSFGVFYPEDDIIAVIDDRAEAERAVAALRAAGIAMADSDLATGEQVLAYERDFQQQQTSLGRLARAVSFLFSDDARYQQEYVEAARAGQHLLVVHAPETEVMERARPILAAHHAHHARHYRHGTVVDL
jgi:hypothetical protein